MLRGGNRCGKALVWLGWGPGRPEWQMRGCAEKEGTRARQARLSEGGILCVGWMLLMENILSVPMWPHRQSFAPGCSSVCGTMKGSVGGTGLTFKSDEELSFQEIF